MMSKIAVPEGMLEAAAEAGKEVDGFVANNLRICLEAALRWLAENPVAPTIGDIDRMVKQSAVPAGSATIRDVAVEWQRIAFLTRSR